MPDSNKLRYYPWLLLMIVTSVLFYPVLDFEYLNFDDQLYIVNDPAIKELSLASLRTIFFEPYAAAWYPLTRFSFAIEFVIFDGNAGGTHFVNLLLHFLNAAILFQVLLLLGTFAYPKNRASVTIRYAALFSCVLFIVHPQHVEAVAWAVQRKELLATFFSLLSISMYLKRRLFAVGVFVTLAMLSKASTIMLPLLFVLLDIALIEPKDMNIRRMARAAWASRWLFLLALVVAILTLLHHQAEDALFYEEQFSQFTKLLLYADNSLHGLYHFLTLQPEMFHLPISEYIINTDLLGIVRLVSMFVLVIGCAAIVLTGPRHVRMGAVGLLYYFIALLPVGGLVVFGNYAFGDRYLYFSSLGIYIMVFVCLSELFRKLEDTPSRRWLNLLLGLVVLAAFIQSYRVLPKWTSTETIWKYDVNQRPDAVFANHQLGQHYLLTGKPELAYAFFEATINSKKERFRIGARTASALYMAEILCGAGREEQAVNILARIPEFGGDMRDIEMLAESLSDFGYESCAQAITARYELSRPTP